MRIAVVTLALLAGCPKKTSEAPPAPGSDQATPVQTAKPDKLSGIQASGTIDMGSANAPTPPAQAGFATGDGFRFAVPSELAPFDHPSKTAYRGTHNGIELAVWATAESFDGDLPALVARERAAVGTAGGAVTLEEPAEVGALPARRLVAKLGASYDMRLLAVRDKRAYIFHCDTASPAAGPECTARGAAFELSAK